MSEIDIERKESGGVPWWVWLLGALLLAALIWYALAAMSAKPNVAVATNDTTIVADNDTMMADNTAVVAPVVGVDNTVMADNSAMMTDANSAMMDDKSMSNSAPGVSTVPAEGSGEAITNILSIVDAKDPASLYGKQVQLLGAPVQAAGSDHFWIGPSFEQKMLVVTDGSTNMNGITTGVAQRDRVDIEGTLMEITDFNDAKTKYNLDDDAVTFLTQKKLLMMATNVKRDQN